MLIQSLLIIFVIVFIYHLQSSKYVQNDKQEEIEKENFHNLKSNINYYECGICGNSENWHFNNPGKDHNYIKGKKRNMLPYEKYAFYHGLPIVN